LTQTPLQLPQRGGGGVAAGSDGLSGKEAGAVTALELEVTSTVVCSVAIGLEALSSTGSLFVTHAEQSKTLLTTRTSTFMPSMFFTIHLIIDSYLVVTQHALYLNMIASRHPLPQISRYRS
jgi:hypothetical protein